MELHQDMVNSPKVIVELGMGDGRLLKTISENDHDNNSFYIGIEVDKSQYEQAISQIKLVNVKLLNGSFEDILPAFSDNSLYRVISVLPDPKYIDQLKEHKWKYLYKIVYEKLKNYGTLELVTEITDDLLQGVPDQVYYKWIEWLKYTFQSMGFQRVTSREGAPPEYSSRCIDQFRADPKRIRMVTLDLQKIIY
jgi:Putative methyltransferase